MKYLRVNKTLFTVILLINENNFNKIERVDI